MAQPIETPFDTIAREDDDAGERRVESPLPLAFKPPLDVIAVGDAIVLELVIPGVARDEIRVERVGRTLIVHGLRADEHGPRGGIYHYAETPRGAFMRVVPLPFEPAADPPFELDRGVLTIRLVVPEAVQPTKKNAPGNADHEQQKEKGKRE